MRRIQVRHSAIIGIAVAIIALIALVLVDSVVYLSRSIQTEQNAEENRSTFWQLGQQLKDGSDYLTDQARVYVVTHDRTAMDNYWKEANETRRRDRAVEALRAANLPSAEWKLLNEAKANSDALMEAETHAMRLVAQSVNLPVAQMPKEVAAYALPAEETAMTAAQQSDRARELMFDDYYKSSKQGILDPIAQFQATMGQRLNAQVSGARTDTRRAVAGLVGLDAVALLLVAALIVLFHHFYLAPIQANIHRLNKGEKALETRGAWELQTLTTGWNTLYTALQAEISRRAALEADLVKARDRAEAGSRAKSLFLAQMSHEIRTPLNTITGYAQLLGDTPLDAQQRQYFACIHTASENLLGILNNVLDFSKLEAGQESLAETDVDLHGLLRDVCALFQAQARQKGISLHLEGTGTVPRWIRTDLKKLRQVLINLLSNAVKFTARGGVTLRAALDKTAHSPQLSLTVADTGPGIAPEDQARIFASFEQADPTTAQQYGGTGLGLSISRGFLQLMGGSLTLQSTLGHGAAFKVSLPYRPGKPRRAPAPADLQGLRGRHILLVDDNVVNLRMEQGMLVRQGLSVETAQSGAQAVALCQKTPYDAILLDVRMAGMDGMQTARAIRNGTGPSCTAPIIALSADAVESSVQAAYDAGMDAYLTKPIDRKKLLQTLASLCRKARPAVPPPNQKAAETGLVEALARAFQEGDFEAIDRVEQKRAALEALLPPETFRALLTAAQQCDMEACAALLRQFCREGATSSCIGSCS